MTTKFNALEFSDRFANNFDHSLRYDPRAKLWYFRSRANSWHCDHGAVQLTALIRKHLPQGHSARDIASVKKLLEQDISLAFVYSSTRKMSPSEGARLLDQRKGDNFK